jgi:hypothetical protein
MTPRPWSWRKRNCERPQVLEREDYPGKVVAMTNEQRFIASCESVGDAYVRQKLSGGRYSESKTAWANNWLEQVDSGKSDATKAEEKGRRLRESTRADVSLSPALLALIVVALIAVITIYMKFA